MFFAGRKRGPWGPLYLSTTIAGVAVSLVLFVSFVWHFYNVHLKSRVFPMSWVWITGQIAPWAIVIETVAMATAWWNRAAPRA